MINACNGAIRIALGGGMRLTSCSSNSGTPRPGLGAYQGRIIGRYADDFLDFVNDLCRVRRRQIDLVDDRQHLQALLERRIAVGDALRLDSLGGIHHQQGAFAGRERARNFVGEVHVPGRIDEVELIDLAARRLETERHALRLDGDAPLALEVHRVEHLRLHFTGIETAALLNEAIGQRRFAVINMSND